MFFFSPFLFDNFCSGLHFHQKVILHDSFAMLEEGE
jgi:hypothetical protein